MGVSPPYRETCQCIHPNINSNRGDETGAVRGLSVNLVTVRGWAVPDHQCGGDLVQTFCEGSLPST